MRFYLEAFATLNRKSIDDADVHVYMQQQQQQQPLVTVPLPKCSPWDSRSFE
jgi:hypothetical protein